MATKAATNANKVFQADDVHISFEDQQKINRFAKHNARMDDLKQELTMRRNDLKSLDEALEELDLYSNDEEIPFLFGEVFITHNTVKTQDLLDAVRENTLKEIDRIEEQSNELKIEMNTLKQHLYHRFGNNISLESEE